MRLDFPITPGNAGLRFLLRNEREYRRDLFRLNPNFRSDLEVWGGAFADALPLVFSIPFYSLFDPGMGERMNKFADMVSGATGSFYPEMSFFSDRFEFYMQRGMDYSISSLFLPRRFSFRIGRVLEQKLDIPRDSLNLGAALGFSSINMFGAMGTAPLFKFYQGDEFSHSVETRISIPKNEKVSWTVRADQALLFYGFSGAELELNNSLTVNSSNRIGEGNRWTDSLGVLWTVPMKKTLLGNLYGAFARMAQGQSSWLTLANLAQSEYELMRRESLEFVFEKVPDVSNGDYIRFSFVLGHESLVRIFGKLNLSVFAKLRIEDNTNTRILSFLGSVGTTLTLIF